MPGNLMMLLVVYPPSRCSMTIFTGHLDEGEGSEFMHFGLGRL